MVEALYWPVLIIWSKDLHYLVNSTIQLATILSSHVLSCHETNTTTIYSIATDIVTDTVSNLHPLQSDQHTNSIALLLDEGIATSKGMGFTLPTMIAQKEAN
jgi:hypothetical protein